MSSGRPASSLEENSFASASEHPLCMPSPSVAPSEMAVMSVATAMGPFANPHDIEFWETMSCATAESECSTAVEDDMTSVCDALEKVSVDTAVAPNEGFACGNGDDSWSTTLSDTGAYDSGSYSDACSLDSEPSFTTAPSSGPGPVVYAVPACPEETIKVVWRNHDHYLASIKQETAPEEDDKTVTITFGEQSHIDDQERYFAPVDDSPSFDSMLCQDRKSQRPVSYYQMPELNKGAVDYAPRRVNVASQYHVAGLEDYHVFNNHPSHTDCHGGLNRFADSFYYGDQNVID